MAGGLAPPEFIGQEWGGQRGIDNFFKGFSLMAQLSAKRNQSEIAMQRLANQAQMSELKHEIDLERVQNQGQHVSDQADHYRMDAENAERRIKLRDEEDAFRQGRTKEQLEGASTLVQTINGISHPKHTQEWRDAVSDALLENPNAAGTSQYKQFQDTLKREKNPTFRTQQITLDNRIQGLGIPKNYLYGALENPDHLTSSDPSTPDTIFVYGGKRQITKPDKTVEEQSVFMPVKKDTWSRLKSTYDQMYGAPDTGRVPPVPPKQPLDADVAKKILTEIKAAHPDWTPDRVNTEARLTAQRNGYE